MGKVRLPKGTACGVLKPNNFMIYLVGGATARLYQQYQMQPGAIQSFLGEKVFSVSGHTWMSLCKIGAFLLIFLYVLWFDTVYDLHLSMGGEKSLLLPQGVFFVLFSLFDITFTFFGSCPFLTVCILSLVTCLECVLNEIMKKI